MFILPTNKEGTGNQWSARRYSKMLIVQLGDIGDVVLTTPTIRAFRETYPDAYLSILVRKPCGSLLAADPHLDEIIELETTLRFLRRLRASRYDLVVDLRTGDRGAILSFVTGARERVGWAVRGKQFWHSLMFTRVIRCRVEAGGPVHPGADQSLCLARAIGVDTTDSMPRLFLSKQDQAGAASLMAACGLGASSRWVTISPFARWEYKEWDDAKWAQVIDLLWQQYRLTAVLVGSSDKLDRTAELITRCSGHAVNLVGKTTLGELAVVLAHSTLHLGVDSAAPHVAAAVGTPTVTIHGPTDWSSWRIADEHHKIITPSFPCVPCRRKGCDDTGKSRCLDACSPETLMEVATELLEALDVR